MRDLDKTPTITVYSKQEIERHNEMENCRRFFVKDKNFWLVTVTEGGDIIGFLGGNNE